MTTAQTKTRKRAKARVPEDVVTKAKRRQAEVERMIRTTVKATRPPPSGWPSDDNNAFMVERWGRVLTWDEFSNQAQRYGADGSEYGYGEDGTLSRSLKGRRSELGDTSSETAPKKARQRRGTGRDVPLVPTFGEGVKAMLEERWTDAVKVFSARVIASPSELNSRTNLAVALGESHRWEDAAREFERVVADPSSKPLPEFHSLGHCYYNLGRHLEAVEAFRQYFLRATRRNPAFSAALVCLGLALQELRHPLAARALLTQGVQMSPDVESFEYLARFFWSETMGPDALGAIAEAAERKLESPGLGSLLEEVLKEMEARAPLGRAIAAPLDWDVQPWTGKEIAECCADILEEERKALSGNKTSASQQETKPKKPMDPRDARLEPFPAGSTCMAIMDAEGNLCGDLAETQRLFSDLVLPLCEPHAEEIDTMTWDERGNT